MRGRGLTAFVRRAPPFGVVLVLIGAAAASVSLATSDSRAPVSAAPLSLSSARSAEARLCSAIPSRRRYVAPSGSDAGPGTIRRPWRTIGRALRTIVAGEAVYVRSGIYAEWLLERRSGTADAPISLRAYPGERPVATGRLKIEGAYFCVAGFRFEGGTSANTNDVLIYVSGADHVAIVGNEIVNASKSGVYVGDEGDPSRNIGIIGNDIRGNGTHSNLDHGVYFGSVNEGLIANNLVVGNLAVGLKLAPGADHVMVVQNTVVRNGRSGILVGGDGTSSSNDNVVANNIVAFSEGWGIRTYWQGASGSRNVALRNLVYANGRGAFWFPGGGMVQQQSIRANPLFVSPDDLRLRSGSRAVDSALPTFSMARDLAGGSRPSGTKPDLGAFER